VAHAGVVQQLAQPGRSQGSCLPSSRFLPADRRYLAETREVGLCPVISRRVKRLALSLLALLVAWLCSACFTTGGSPDENPPAGDNRPASSEPTDSGEPAQQTLAFGKSYTWDDGVTLSVGKPQKFKPSEYAAVKKAKGHLRFTVTVVNKSEKPVDLGLTFITAQSSNKEAEQVFDSDKGLESSPDTKLLKGRESEFDVGFGVADPKDVVMEVALQDDFERPNILYST
jgi:hypothetical protein